MDMLHYKRENSAGRTVACRSGSNFALRRRKASCVALCMVPHRCFPSVRENSKNPPNSF